MRSITRAFEILERFRQVQRPLSLTELVRDLGYLSPGVAERIAAHVPQIGEVLLAHIRPLVKAGRARRHPRSGERPFSNGEARSATISE